MKGYQIVEIEWADSCQDISGAQIPADEARAMEPIKMSNCGYYVGLNSTKTAHILASNVSEEGQLRSIMLIPTCNVIRLKKAMVR